MQLKMQLVKIFSVLHKEIHKGAFKCEKCQIPFTKQALIAHRSRCQANERRKFVDTKRFPCQCKICLKRYRCQSQLSNFTKSQIDKNELKLKFNSFSATCGDSQRCL